MAKEFKLKTEKELTEAELLKYEIAEELGLMEKVEKSGWKSLTSKESGKIGGLMTKRLRNGNKWKSLNIKCKNYNDMEK